MSSEDMTQYKEEKKDSTAVLTGFPSQMKGNLQDKCSYSRKKNAALEKFKNRLLTQPRPQKTASALQGQKRTHMIFNHHRTKAEKKLDHLPEPDFKEKGQFKLNVALACILGVTKSQAKE